MNSHVILLVDDNIDDVSLTLWAFKKSGLNAEVIVACDGREALDLLLPPDRSARLCPAIVLLDINMPRMGGLETLQVLRADAATKVLPVIMLTSSVDDRDMMESYDLGANAYIQKPVNSGEFLIAARALGIFWLDINKHPLSSPGRRTQGSGLLTGEADTLGGQPGFLESQGPAVAAMGDARVHEQWSTIGDGEGGGVG